MKITGHKLRHAAIQALRRLVQVSVIGLITVMAYLSLYGHYRATRTLEEELQQTGTRAAVLARYDRHIRVMHDPQEFLDHNKGTVWSAIVLGVDMTDPLAAAEAIAAGKTIHWPLLASILIPVAATLLLGKVFCSWICPANLLFEITGKLRGLLRFAELPPAEVEFSRANKYVLLGVGLLIAVIVGLPIFALVYPPAAISRLLHGWVFGTHVNGILTVLGVIAVIELVVSPRWWCRTMCPGGALYGLIGWPRLLRVNLDAARCTKCGTCQPACEPGLDPARQSSGIECDNCGECIRRCPERALGFGVGFPRRPSTAKTATMITALTVILLAPAKIHAHHILGLPHYSYKENYPQAPVLEYPATTGPYSVLLQSYPGKPSPGEQVNLVFDIKNTETGKHYERPIEIRVVQTFTFGDNREILSTTKNPIGDVLYKVYPTFPEDGEYVVELTMDVEGQEETIGFLMVIGDPSPTASIMITLCCGLAVFLISVRAIKKKRDRRRSTASETPSPDQRSGADTP